MAKNEPQLYKPADACRMAEVAPYVLRYWETEFAALSEGKEKGGARLYTARDVQIIARIRQLLYDEGFTVAGAKKRLDAEIQEGKFDGGAPEGGARRQPEKKAAAAEPAPPPPAAPRPMVAAVAPPPTPKPTAVASAPTPSPAPPTSFPERKMVIKELKEIVRMLEQPKKR